MFLSIIGNKKSRRILPHFELIFARFARNFEKFASF